MSTFLQKNKKKGALAALLLFLRTRKTATSLLLLVAISSFVFVSPSNLILSFPGGTRVAAGVAWIAGKAGVDISRWGLIGGKDDYGNLLAAFRAAKAGGGKAGWSAFMGGAPAEGKLGEGSLGFVKGSRKDLAAAGGSGARLAKPGSVAGVLNPDDARNRGEGVALSEEDLTGERAGFVQTAFGSGFSGGPNVGVEGAYARAEFFKGSGSAASGKLEDKVAGGLEGIKAPAGKGVQIAKGAKGQISAAKAGAINTRMNQGMKAAHKVGGQMAFVQLAAGSGRAAVSIKPEVATEFAATNTGTVYDGNDIDGANTGILTMDGEPIPGVPLENDIPEVADVAKITECMDKVQQCQTEKQAYFIEVGNHQRQIEIWAGQLPNACDDECDCDPCDDLQGKILNKCYGELKPTLAKINKDCPLPSYCAALGVDMPPNSETDPGRDLCATPKFDCGCGGLSCILCIF